MISHRREKNERRRPIASALAIVTLWRHWVRHSQIRQSTYQLND